MRGLGALAIMLLVGFWTELASAGTFQAFGPENITRSTGKPVAVTKNFTVLNPNTSYTIRINNGGISGEFAKVSSAVITLNGAQIVSPNEFSQTVTVIEKPITLSTSNALAIELRSKPGSGITIQVIGIDNDPPVITAAVNPAANTAGWHNADVTVSFDCTDAISGIASCSAPVTVTTEGANQVISGTAVDRAGNSAVVSVAIDSDKTSPVVSITEPADGTRFSTTPVTVTGTVTETLSGISTVTCSGIAAVLSGSSFSCDVPLTDGSNAIVVQAVDIAGNTGGSTVTVFFSRGPAVRITAPEPLALFNSSPITVTGTVANSTASVVVNGVPASVSGGSFSATVALREGNNTLTAVATNTFGQVDTASIQVTLDTTPPRVTIDSPADSFVTTNPSTTVAGMINDIVVGTVNGGQAQVTVNGIAAQVANRSFLVADVPLSPGPNTLTAIGVDRAGNVASTHIIVTFQPIVARPQIQLISGNNQRAPIGSPLPEPLIVALTDATGNPVPGKTVIFKVVENNGTLTNGLNTARSLALTTDAQGRAQVRWTLGTRAGAGNNRVEATAVGFTSSAFFTAIAAPSAAAKINVDSGSNQTGVVGESLPRPLVAVVTDSGHNRLANVPVTFTVLQGGGSFNGQPALTLNTDSDGRALAVLTLGLQEGIENHVVEATFPGNPGLPASFVASGKVAGDPAQTRISGVVLDNTDRPIPGVTLRIEGTALVTQANDQGQFLLQPAPVGHLQLIADGSTAQRPGTWPTLEYDLVTISGQNNTIGMPIYLLPLDLPNGLFVDETTGGRLTLPQVPGFSLSVAPGSATFPDGSRSGVVSVTVVHADKIPMTPNFGQQPRFIVTIQPAGVHFDPPAAITIPNIDGLAPGEVTELYSFDHDLGQFVAIGTGTVSEDGTVVRSDLGVGIIKGGWHCGGNPVQTGSCCDCPDCQRCANNNCVADAAQAGQNCTDPSGQPGVCQNGTCVAQGQAGLEVFQPADNTLFDITVVPQMPTITAVARIINSLPDPTATTTFDWTARIRFQAQVCPNGPNRQINPPDVVQSIVGGQFTPGFNFIRGGDLTFIASATVDGNVLQDQTQGLKIRGTNPPRTAIQNALPHDILRRIACQESLQTQFNAPANGGVSECPLFSSDGLGGVGIMQITRPAPTDDQVWDWTQNVAAGIILFGQKIAIAQGHPSQVRTSPGFINLVNSLNQNRQQQGLPPLTVTLPEFTTGDFNNNRQQLELDSVRGYNGYGGQDQFGLNLHEFRVAIDVSGNLQVIIDPQTGTAEAVWEQVPAADRPQGFGDPDYVNNVLGRSPTCGG